jgi:TolB-like protein/class 3 adenylate cyclase/Flp pilus assembly protein TadD
MAPLEPQGIQRRLAAILAADVVGYSRLMGEDEAGTLAQLKTHRKELIDPKTAEHHGRVVKLMGDGVLVEFASVADAVECAVEIQRAMAKRNAETPEEHRIEFRIGINLGDVIVEGQDIYGDGVNIASRLEGLAQPGGVCVSGKVYDEVANKLRFGFEDLGEQQVKNIAEPVRVYRVLPDPDAPGGAINRGKSRRRPSRWPVTAAAVAILIVLAGGLAWWRPWSADIETASVERMAFPLPDKPSIAVLPFANLSGDPDQGYFADGMTDDLITDLSKVSGLFVIARNSSFVYKGQTVEIRQVAEDLGVRYVVEGSVRRAGDTVRVNAQLIDATTGGHVWAERFDGSVADIFSVQDEFIRKIVKALALNLTEGEQEEIGRGQTEKVEAREAFQKGWELYLRFTAGDNAKAASHFEHAIELDPEYGRAYAALSMVYFRATDWAWAAPLEMSLLIHGESRPEGRRYLAKAQTYKTALAHVAATKLHLYMGRHEEGLHEAARAIALDPNDPEAHIAMAWAMITSNKPEAGLEFVETAMRLNPAYPNHYVIALGIAYFAMGDLEHAATVLSEGLEQDPDAIELAPPLASTLASLGRRQKAQEALQRWKPGASQLELQNFPNIYRFPYRWPNEDHRVFDRLFDGLHIAALPLEIKVPDLADTLKQDNPLNRKSAAQTLGRFGPVAEAAVPDLIAALADEFEDVRKEAALALGKIGPAAKNAIPALVAMQEESLVGHYAKEALKEIRGR